jgi:hypothetical protein
VSWQDSKGTVYSAQELSDFAFDRLYSHIEKSFR